MQHVLTSRPERHFVVDAILPKPSAKNQSVAAFRSSLSQYLGSWEFKKRWNALKAQVSVSWRPALDKQESYTAVCMESSATFLT